MRLGCASALVDGEIVPGDVEVADGVVTAIGRSPAAGGGLAVPGLVDLQVNGFAGVDLRGADADGYARAAAALADHGVTAAQPTFYSCSVEDYERSLHQLAAVLADPPAGARFLPAHLEGPFLSSTWRGAHDVEHLLPPDLTTMDRLLGAGPVGFVTLAPELPGALEMIEHLRARDVVVSIGHTDATAEQTRDAVRAGATHLTHCWNAHRRLGSRDPGPAGVALAGSDLVVGLIADLVHVSPEIVALTMRAGAGRVAVTTDAVAPAGTTRPADSTAPESEHRLADGTLAGGVAAPDDCLRNLVSVGVDLGAAVDACGGVQRSLLGLPEVRLRPGDPADVAVLDDVLAVRRTYVAGRLVGGDGDVDRPVRAT